MKTELMRYSKLLPLILVLFALASQASSATENSNSEAPLKRQYLDRYLYWDIDAGLYGGITKKLPFQPTCAHGYSGGYGFNEGSDDVFYDFFKAIDFTGLMWEMIDPEPIYCNGAMLIIPHYLLNKDFSIEGLDESGCTERVPYCRAKYLLDMAATQGSILVYYREFPTQIDLRKLVSLNDLLSSSAIDTYEASRSQLYKAISLVSLIWLMLLVFSYWFYTRHLTSWLKTAFNLLLIAIGLLSIPFIWLYKKITGRWYRPASIADELYKLKLLRDSGEISENEYLQLKNRLLR
jgi:hypothetical protein